MLNGLSGRARPAWCDQLDDGPALVSGGESGEVRVNCVFGIRPNQVKGPAAVVGERVYRPAGGRTTELTKPLDEGALVATRGTANEVEHAHLRFPQLTVARRPHSSATMATLMSTAAT